MRNLLLRPIRNGRPQPESVTFSSDTHTFTQMQNSLGTEFLDTSVGAPPSRHTQIELEQIRHKLRRLGSVGKSRGNTQTFGTSI